MIKLKKLDEPEILKKNKDVWKEEYLKAKDSGIISETIKTKYNNEAIKKRLLEETYNKCVYCETKLSYTSAQIEHLLPKSEFPEKIVEWTNLTIACGDCNLHKRDKVSTKTPILNLYIDNPKKFLKALGALILHTAGNSRGEITHKLLELNEGRLYEKRTEKIKSLSNLVDKYATSDELLKNVLGRELQKESEKNKEFSFVVEAYIKSQCSL